MKKKTIIDGAMFIKGDKIIDIGKSEYILEKYNWDTTVEKTLEVYMGGER